MTDGVGTPTGTGRRRVGRATRQGRAGAALAGLTLTALIGVALTVLTAWPAAPIEPPLATPGTPTADTVRPVPGEVTAEFDPPDRPYGSGRRGVRLAAEPGELVRAARGGDVVFAGSVAGTPWVSVAHGGGLRTSYGPVTPGVRAGDSVVAGEAVGRLADADEDGLHWGARLQGTYIDPLDLLRAWRPVLVPREEQPG